MLSGNVGIQVVKPAAKVHREALNGPLVLHKHTEIKLDVLFGCVRRRVFDDGGRRSTQELIRHIIVRPGALPAIARLRLHADFERM